MTPARGLTPSQVAAFHQDGYLIIRNALLPSTVAALLAETGSLLRGFALADGHHHHPPTRFSTGSGPDAEHVGGDYFLTSGDKVRFFLEEDAFDAATGALARPGAEAVNKIGHGLHVANGTFAGLLDARPGEVSPAAVARALSYVDPRCLQSMVICKGAGVGGAVPPHQDSSFLFTEEPSATGFWYALEDATTENGCLSFLPGSHRWAGVERRLVRRRGGGATEMVDNDGSRFPRGEGGRRGRPSASGGDDDQQAGGYVPGEVKAGDLVLIHGNLLHKSERNTSARSRIIYTFHIIEGHDRVYDERNWLQPGEGGFTRLYA